MNKSLFDQILMENVVHSTGIDLFGYDFGGKEYPNHYNHSAFDDFVHQMERDYPVHFTSYWKGKGSELKSQKGQPPKMASVASSSRFCYLALRNGTQGLGVDAEPEFEHSCPITGIKGGTPPQMDAYIENGNIFVEVKCHEIFDSHSIELSNQYHRFVFAQDNDFGFVPASNENHAPIVLSRKAFGLDETQTMLDIKQMICHLLGIRSHKQPNEKATLVYLFFKPKVFKEEQRREIDTLFQALQKEIETVFGGNNSPVRKFAEENHIQLKAIAQYSEVMSPLTEENRIVLFP